MNDPCCPCRVSTFIFQHNKNQSVDEFHCFYWMSQYTTRTGCIENNDVNSHSNMHPKRKWVNKIRAAYTKIYIFIFLHQDWNCSKCLWTVSVQRTAALVALSCWSSYIFLERRNSCDLNYNPEFLFIASTLNVASSMVPAAPSDVYWCTFDNIKMFHVPFCQRTMRFKKYEENSKTIDDSNWIRLGLIPSQLQPEPNVALL